jgi:hypothetical protein
MDNIKNGVNDISQWLKIHDIQDNLDYESVQPFKNKTRIKYQLLKQEKIYRDDHEHKKLNANVPRMCARVCHRSFSCDEVLDMARNDLSLNLGKGRLSCGFLEKYLECDCSNCICNATRTESTHEKSLREKAYNHAKRKHHPKRMLQDDNVTQIEADRELSSTVDEEFFTRQLFLYGNRKKISIDLSLTWQWLPEWEAILKNVLQPTNITTDTLLSDSNATEMAWWVWLQIFIHYPHIINEVEQKMGYVVIQLLLCWFLSLNFNN